MVPRFSLVPVVLPPACCLGSPGKNPPRVGVDVPFLPVRSGVLGVSRRGLPPLVSGRLAVSALKSDALG